MMSKPVTLSTGFLSEVKRFSWIVAAISAPVPMWRGASWTITARPVFWTDAMMVSLSNGEMLRMSTISHEIPSLAASAAASRHSRTMAPQLIRVTSVPCCTMPALPIGMK